MKEDCPSEVKVLFYFVLPSPHFFMVKTKHSVTVTKKKAWQQQFQLCKLHRFASVTCTSWGLFAFLQPCWKYLDFWFTEYNRTSSHLSKIACLCWGPQLFSKNEIHCFPCLDLVTGVCLSKNAQCILSQFSKSLHSSIIYLAERIIMEGCIFKEVVSGIHVGATCACL